ncbi:MAG: SDR family oxidoreductase [Candidatus Omnitrophica bacterium]|nr:SDR family oxidoreductase [Candidatus Omnitrophota bacterium]
MSSPQTALVTGASTGIGFELAKLLARDGCSLVLVSRTPEPLERAAGELREKYSVQVRCIPKDLAIPGAARELSQELARQSLSIQILINNAGFGRQMLFHKTDFKTISEMIHLNVTALTELTHLLLPGILAARGKIMNVASTAAFQPGPSMAVYYATKAYVLSFSQALCLELAKTGVSVTTLCPGPTDTPFRERAGMTDAPIFRLGGMPAARVAQAGYAGLKVGCPVVVPGATNLLATWLVRWVSPLFAARVVAVLHQPVQDKKAFHFNGEDP